MITRALLLAFLLSSCANNWLVGYTPETNFLTFDHPNSESVAADVRAQADKLCQQRTRTAIRTANVCSLTKCATTYQCEDNVHITNGGLESTPR